MTTHLPDQNFRPVSHLCVSCRRQLSTGKHARVSLLLFKPPRNGNLSANGTTSTHQDFKWAVRLSLVEQQSNLTNSTFDTIDFLYEDLPHLFDDQGIDRTMYDEKVKYRDPITKHDTISGYLFNIRLLKQLFQPDFQLHKVQILPKPNKEELGLRKVEGGIAIVSKFSGKPTEDIVRENERSLRMSALKDGLKPKQGCLFARYNDPGRTWDFIMRNEVLIWLEEFTLD